VKRRTWPPAPPVSAALLGALLLLWPTVAAGDGDARSAFLVRQLTSARDPRARVQAAVALGSTEDPGAVAPLCAALSDPDPLVRAAVARSLPSTREAGALECLLGHGEDADALARSDIGRAVASLRALRERRPRVYVVLAPVADASDPPADAALLASLRTRLAGRLRWMGAEVGPDEQDPSSARDARARSPLRGFQLRARLARRGPEVAVVVACLTFPDLEVLGEVSGRASGGRPEDAVRALVPRLLQDLATTFEWNL